MKKGKIELEITMGGALAIQENIKYLTEEVLKRAEQIAIERNKSGKYPTYLERCDVERAVELIRELEDATSN